MGADFYLVLFLKCPSESFHGFSFAPEQMSSNGSVWLFFLLFSPSSLSFRHGTLSQHQCTLNQHMKNMFRTRFWKWLQNKILKMASLCGSEIEKNTDNPSGDLIVIFACPPKGQLISECLFGVSITFLQKTNENKLTNSKVEFAR